MIINLQYSTAQYLTIILQDHSDTHLVAFYCHRNQFFSRNSFHQTHQTPNVFPPVFRALGSSPWEILGVAPGATPAEVKKAYRRKALTHGPNEGSL